MPLLGESPENNPFPAKMRLFERKYPLLWRKYPFLGENPENTPFWGDNAENTDPDSHAKIGLVFLILSVSMDICLQLEVWKSTNPEA